MAPNNEEIVRLKFLEVLSEKARIVLTTLSDLPTRTLAETADKISEKLNIRQSSVNAINDNAGYSTDSGYDRLNTRIDELAVTIQAISTRRRSPSYDWGRNGFMYYERGHPGNSQSKSRRRFNKEGKFC